MKLRKKSKVSKKQSRKKLAKQSTVVDQKLRLFIDPASISSGWAIFQGKELQSHGTIAVSKKFSIFNRLEYLRNCYSSTFNRAGFDEVHIEQLPGRCHHYTHWSVGVIGTALQPYAKTVAGDIPVRSWQKSTGWREIETEWAERGYKSEDEFAAVCMGRYWIKEKI